MDELAAQIAIAFADYVERWELAPPSEAIVARQNGHLFKAGWYLGWVFGEEDGREYFEWVTEHRMADMEHVRVFADGDLLLLDTPRSGYVYPEGATTSTGPGSRPITSIGTGASTPSCVSAGCSLSRARTCPPTTSTSTSGPDRPTIRRRLETTGPASEPPRRVEVQLLAAGLEESDGLWRDGDEVGVAVSEAGVFVGWLDVIWASVVGAGVAAEGRRTPYPAAASRGRSPRRSSVPARAEIRRCVNVDLLPASLRPRAHALEGGLPGVCRATPRCGALTR